MLSYQDVYAAARALNADQIPMTRWIDYLENTWTPASRLAYEGESDAVAFLLSRGADPNRIAEGYARANNHKMVAYYRSKYPDSVSWIARGYAIAGNHEQVESYRSQYGANVNYIAAGYAMASDDANVEFYRLHYSVSPSVIAGAYAEMNNRERVAVYQELGADPNSIAAGYILSHQDEIVEQYIEEYGVHHYRLLNNYVLTGDHVSVAALCKQNPKLAEYAVKCYAQANNHEQVAAYQEAYQVDLDFSLEGYALGRHHAKVIEILMQKIVQEVGELKKSWFYDHSDKIESLRELHQYLIAPSPRDKTLGDLLLRLGMPMNALTDRHPMIVNSVLLHTPKSVHKDQNDYKSILRQERKNDELASTSSESDNDSVQPVAKTGLRYRGPRPD